MDEALLYQYCHQAIAILIKDGGLDLDDCRHISEEYAKAIFTEIKDSPATMSQNTKQVKLGILKANLTEAQKIYDSAYYIRKAQEKESQQIILHATKESAQAASRSAESAEKANEIARKSNNKATLANIIALAALISTVLYNFCQYRSFNDKSNCNVATSRETIIGGDTAYCHPSAQNDSVDIIRNKKLIKE